MDLPSKETHNENSTSFLLPVSVIKTVESAEYFYQPPILCNRTHGDYLNWLLIVHETRQSSLCLDSGSPAYKHLISWDFSQTEVVSLIKETFTSQDQVEAIDHLGRDDIQTFIDVVDEVRLTHNPLESDLIVMFALCLVCLTVTVHPPMARPWSSPVFHHCFGASVWVLYTRYAVTMVCFQDCWKSHSTTID